MRAFLTLTCGVIGACLVTAAALTCILFALMGHAGDLLQAVFTMIMWAVGFGLAFIVTSIVGVMGGVLDGPTPKGGSDV